MHTTHTIQDIASELMVKGKGILAADESEGTMQKRLLGIGLEYSEENSRRFRDILFTTPTIEQYLSGVICYETTLHQKATDGTPFVEVLAEKGILVGVKVDKGLEVFAGSPQEEISRGLDTLATRLVAYKEKGAHFTKWRSVIRITDTLPSEIALIANAHVLGQYAKIVQERGLVPMVEPEVLFEGTHTLERSEEVLGQTLTILFETLAQYRVSLEGLILKTSMALPGKESGIPLVAQDIARATMRALVSSVPKETSGVVFLSGGQTSEQAIEHLHALRAEGGALWPFTFSYSRALEEPVLSVWKGEDALAVSAQDVFVQTLQKAIHK